MEQYLYPAQILLPDFTDGVDAKKWAVIACDQFTSEPAYWEEADSLVGEAPSTLRMILPEAWLADAAVRIPLINAAMEQYLASVLRVHPDSMVYVERTQSDGCVRRGIVGMIDLEQYDYRNGAQTLIRATEGTVLERIPPRVTIRRDAPLELPHVMLLIDDPACTVIEPLTKPVRERKCAYVTELLLSGGKIRGEYLSCAEMESVNRALRALATPEAMEEKYGADTDKPLLFAVGDGNHSLAAAKAVYEAIKEELGERALEHPARYALCEMVNLHDPALQFEPIFRVVFGEEPESVIEDFRRYAAALDGNGTTQTVFCVTAAGEEKVTVECPVQQLTVGTLQTFLDEWLPRHPGYTVDYIHDEGSARALVAGGNGVSFLFAGMRKEELFRTVLLDGALPRKTFSMGHARDKRYYMEARKIR